MPGPQLPLTAVHAFLARFYHDERHHNVEAERIFNAISGSVAEKSTVNENGTPIVTNDVIDGLIRDAIIKVICEIEGEDEIVPLENMLDFFNSAVNRGALRASYQMWVFTQMAIHAEALKNKEREEKPDKGKNPADVILAPEAVDEAE